ncbi:MAG: 3-dehydroquinate synthase [Lachnospiraceae bacterium]|nr:3-dehydroquinate synthase [Lachnospiraceae bacterium]
MPVEKIMVHKEGIPVYPICLTDSFEDFGEALSSFSVSGRKVCIVTDSHVGGLYLKQMEQICKRFFHTVVCFSFPAGEEHKTLDTVKALYEFLITNSFDRKDFLLALGGGVTGDLTGFTAATYLRGIRFIQVPTTLLSQVDSSIGGKTGVDFDAYKNMVGAFYMPELVYINVSVLKSLSEEQFSSGMGEVIKHGCIRSANYYQWISENREAVRLRRKEALMEVVRGSCLIKRAVVEEDPTEQGIRALLNFGHTLGHAIEKEMNFTMSHGACVGVGCMAAAWISVRHGFLSEEILEDMADLFSYFGLPTKVSNLSPDHILETTTHDKKMDSGVIRFILLKQIGEAYIDRSVTADEMKEAIFYLAD